MYFTEYNARYKVRVDFRKGRCARGNFRPTFWLEEILKLIIPDSFFDRGTSSCVIAAVETKSPGKPVSVLWPQRLG